MIRSMSEILREVSEAPTKEDKINILRKNDHPALRQLVELAYHPNVFWLLPKGIPPFKPSNLTDIEGRLYSEMKRMHLFIEGCGTDLPMSRREQLFVQILETVPPEDALLLCEVKDRNMPFDGIDKNLIRETWPGLLPNE